MTRRPLMALLLMLLPLAACSEGNDKNRVGVGVSGVNYTNQEFGGYAVREPGKEKSSAGGESLGPYSAGGIMCCYPLPKEWHEGLQVELVIRRANQGETYEERAQDYKRRKESGTLNEYIKVDVPRYDNADNAMLWVEMLPEDKYKVVVSNVDPNHDDWPGDIKGWPVPSDEYRRKLIDREVNEVTSRIERTETNLREIKKGSESVIKEYWDIRLDTAPEDMAIFKGWDDPKFKAYLEESLESYINRDRRKLESLREMRP